MQQLLDKDGVQIAVADVFVAVTEGFNGVNGSETVLYPLSAIGDNCTVADYVPPPPIQPTPEKANRWITKAAFRNRFTDTEKITSELMSIDNQSDALQKRQIAAALRVSNADVMASTYIDLDRPDTIKGARMMESIGVIAKGRADEILLAEITDVERFVR